MAKGFHRSDTSSSNSASSSPYHSRSSTPLASSSSSSSSSSADNSSSAMSKIFLHSQVRKLILEEELFVKLALGEAEKIRQFQQETMGMPLNRPSPLGLN